MQQFGRNLLILIIGLVLGAALGLYLGWVAWPLEYTDANPSVLDVRYQEEYVQMVADVYAQERDLAVAQVRLGQLGADANELLLATVNGRLLDDSDEAALRRLAVLAADLGLSSPAVNSILAEDGA